MKQGTWHLGYNHTGTSVVKKLFHNPEGRYGKIPESGIFALTLLSWIRFRNHVLDIHLWLPNTAAAYRMRSSDGYL